MFLRGLAVLPYACRTPIATSASHAPSKTGSPHVPFAEKPKTALSEIFFLYALSLRRRQRNRSQGGSRFECDKGSRVRWTDVRAKHRQHRDTYFPPSAGGRALPNDQPERDFYCLYFDTHMHPGENRCLPLSEREGKSPPPPRICCCCCFYIPRWDGDCCASVRIVWHGYQCTCGSRSRWAVLFSRTASETHQQQVRVTSDLRWDVRSRERTSVRAEYRKTHKRAAAAAEQTIKPILREAGRFALPLSSC